MVTECSLEGRCWWGYCTATCSVRKELADWKRGDAKTDIYILFKRSVTTVSAKFGLWLGREVSRWWGFVCRKGGENLLEVAGLQGWMGRQGWAGKHKCMGYL